MELESFEFSRQICELAFSIFVEKEPCIGEARTDDPLVALTDKALWVVAAVDDGEELRRQSSRPRSRE